jgi:glycosyltransferase involved in cell wall biosynthesis
MRVGVDARHLTSGRGVARYTRSLLGALATTFPDDEWLAFVPGRDPVRAPPPGVRLVRHPLPGRALFGAAAVVRRPRLDRLLGGVDVIWAPAPAPLAVSGDVPLVLTVHDRSFELRPGDFTPYERLWHRLARPRALAVSAAAVVCDTEAGSADLARTWGVAASVVSPAPLATTSPPEPDGAAPYLLFVGALEPRKAPDVLAAAYARARAGGLEADLVVVGEGRVPIAGPGVFRRPESADDAALAALYAGALAVVAPSWVEGFGLPPVEAAALGTPSIVSDLAVFAETLGAGALRVPPGDPAALADALARIATDDDLRERLGAAARRAAARYDWTRAAHALHAILERAAR